MILRGMGFENTLITRGYGIIKKLVVELIQLVTNFYNRIILRTIFKDAEIISLKSVFYNNILMRSNIDLVPQQKIALVTNFNKMIMLKSNIALKRA